MKNRVISSVTIFPNENGFVLVAAMSCLVVLSMIGIAAMNTSNVEKEIAQNVNIAEKTFYRSDGGTEIAIEMIEWNLGCDLGFNRANITDTDPTEFFQIGGLHIVDSDFARRDGFGDLPWDPTQIGLPVGTGINADYVPSNGARSIQIPEYMLAPNDSAPHTNLAIFGPSGFGAGGNAINMGDEYAGKAKNLGSGGTGSSLNVFSQAIGNANSQAVVRLIWRHMWGQEGECRPY